MCLSWGCAPRGRGVREAHGAGDGVLSKLWSQLETGFSLIPWAPEHRLQQKVSSSLRKGAWPFMHLPPNQISQPLVDSPWCNLLNRVVPSHLRAIL